MPTVTLTEQNFHQVVSGNHIVLIDWWAGWCGPCRHFAPVYEASSDQHPDIVHGKVDTEAEVALTAMAQVDRFPTLMAFREGLLVYNQAGFLPAADLEEVVQQVRWLDMDQVRKELAAQGAAPQQAEPVAAATGGAARMAGPASGPVQYGWPGL
ncbi:thioredoxin 1 [Nocardia amikacinitolerans]|nr:thioredoxin 1 [Nocardia amikacinitolerans]